jgi:hypothetical protein
MGKVGGMGVSSIANTQSSFELQKLMANDFTVLVTKLSRPHLKMTRGDYCRANKVAGTEGRGEAVGYLDDVNSPGSSTLQLPSNSFDQLLGFLERTMIHDEDHQNKSCCMGQPLQHACSHQKDAIRQEEVIEVSGVSLVGLLLAVEQQLKKLAW